MKQVIWSWILLSAASAAMGAETSAAQGAAQGEAPAANPPVAAAPEDGAVTDERVAGLIAQLGDRDPQVRDDAERKLIAIGKPAVELLKQAATLDDPEIRDRAETLARRLQQPPMPGGPLRIVRGARTTAHSLKGGGPLIEFYEDGRQIIVTQGENAIEVTVAQARGAETERQTYRAVNAEQLRRESPDAYVVYQRALELDRDYMPNRGPFVLDRARMILPAPLEALNNLIEDRMERQGVEPAQRREVRQLMEHARVTSPSTGLVAPELDNEDRLSEFFNSADALRNKLAELGLPEGDDALPPRRTARLGVQLQGEQLSISTVAANERGEKMGLQPGDLIQKLNGKPVSTVVELREALAAAKGPIVIEGMRDGKTITFKEPEPAAK